MIYSFSEKGIKHGGNKMSMRWAPLAGSSHMEKDSTT